MCNPLPLVYWPLLWWPCYLSGLATALASKSSVAAGCSLRLIVRTPLLKLHVSQLQLKPAAALPRSKKETVLRLVSR